MNRVSELFEKLKINAEETKGLDVGAVEAIINALQENNEQFDEATIKSILEAVVALLEIDVPESKAKVLMLIAEIAKSEETRVPCVKAGLISAILSNLESDDPNVVLQALRAIGNISFDNELAKSTLLENQGAEKIVKKLEVLEKSFNENSDNKLELAACGSMLNVASDDEKGKASFSESDGVTILMKVLQESDDKEFVDLVFEIFSSLVVDDNVKKALVQQGYAEHLANIVSSAKNVTDDESLREKVQSAADMIVMLLTEDDSMKLLFNDGDGSVYKMCVSWLSSGDQHLEISGCLAVGNFGRTDEHCIKLVQQGVHVQLLQLLARTTKRENMGRHQQAVFSALKNLSMPAANKVKLVESGCLDVILPLLSTQSPFVQFKVLGTLRMLLTGQADVANRIVSSNEHLSTLVRCCESSGHEGVKSEASRMLAVIVKEAKSAEVSQKLITSGGLTPIVAMVSSEHVIMQNEALIALAVMSSTVGENCFPKFRESGVIQTLIKMIKTEGINPQTCYNAMAVLESFSLKEYFRRDLEVAGLSKALDDLTTNENENVKKRALIILTRIKAYKLAQQE
ncbi:rap1 GTPase-GDP dissociation stimulator 1-like [Orbicella faveolata]|uniref:rap1 GTPase-GDP dissociation stimulator 1-like n=1 Tax=Orbicella faveolata TaxID=48498 RepID=UPI0009E4233C|nr:rap1 GTPase-GDP dissociation stimulator 1-like [Orbicella faveolata]